MSRFNNYDFDKKTKSLIEGKTSDEVINGLAEELAHKEVYTNMTEFVAPMIKASYGWSFKEMSNWPLSYEEQDEALYNANLVRGYSEEELADYDREDERLRSEDILVYYSVSDHLAYQLQQAGEAVIETGCSYIWCCASWGQPLNMEYPIVKIATYLGIQREQLEAIDGFNPYAPEHQPSDDDDGDDEEEESKNDE